MVLEREVRVFPGSLGQRTLCHQKSHLLLSGALHMALSAWDLGLLSHLGEVIPQHYHL